MAAAVCAQTAARVAPIGGGRGALRRLAAPRWHWRPVQRAVRLACGAVAPRSVRVRSSLAARVRIRPGSIYRASPRLMFPQSTPCVSPQSMCVASHGVSWRHAHSRHLTHHACLCTWSCTAPLLKQRGFQVSGTRARLLERRANGWRLRACPSRARHPFKAYASFTSHVHLLLSTPLRHSRRKSSVYPHAHIPAVPGGFSVDVMRASTARRGSVARQITRKCEQHGGLCTQWTHKASWTNGFPSRFQVVVATREKRIVHAACALTGATHSPGIGGAPLRMALLLRPGCEECLLRSKGRGVGRPMSDVVVTSGNAAPSNTHKEGGASFLVARGRWPCHQGARCSGANRLQPERASNPTTEGSHAIRAACTSPTRMHEVARGTSRTAATTRRFSTSLYSSYGKFLLQAVELYDIPPDAGLPRNPSNVHNYLPVLNRRRA